MMRQETPLYLLPYQQAVLDADRLISSPPPTSNVVSGFSGHVVVDEFDSLLIDMQDYLPGGDFPLTYEQALDQARQGRRPRRGIRLVQSCPPASNVVRGYSGRVVVDEFNPILIDMEQPSNAEGYCGWRIVPQEEIQP